MLPGIIILQITVNLWIHFSCVLYHNPVAVWNQLESLLQPKQIGNLSVSVVSRRDHYQPFRHFSNIGVLPIVCWLTQNLLIRGWSFANSCFGYFPAVIFIFPSSFWFRHFLIGGCGTTRKYVFRRRLLRNWVFSKYERTFLVSTEANFVFTESKWAFAGTL